MTLPTHKGITANLAKKIVSKVANHLFEKKDYSYALFFGHLTIEKILKAIFTDKKDKTPPFSHNLVYLSEKADLELNDENLELLEEVSDFNLEARYPDDKFSFYKKSTSEFTENKLKQIEELKKWLLQKASTVNLIKKYIARLKKITSLLKKCCCLVHT